MVRELFDSSDGSGEEKDISKIEINEDFARRHEYNKKREDLQRLDELKKKGVISDSSESDSEESSDEFLEDDTKKDLEFFNALLRVKNKDPVLRNKEAKLFESESESEDEKDEMEKKGRRKEKPMYLKDVTAKHLIEEGPEFGDKEEDGKGFKSYSEEQEELKKAFFDAVETDLIGDDDGEDLFKVKESGNNVEDEDDDNAVEVEKKLDEYFGNGEKLDENAVFLKDYFRNKMWLDKGDNGKMSDEEDLDALEDEKEIDRQEDYERKFNFRFEEDPDDRVMGHARVVEGSVRKKTNARKLQRERKEERIAQAEFERKEELKYLKNLKKKEMNEKLKKIRETAGIGGEAVCNLDVDDLEDEFDPEEYDKKMKKAFGDDYYEANDADPEFGSDDDEDDGEIKKPNFDEEDKLLGLPRGWADDLDGKNDGFKAARERFLKQGVNKEEEVKATTAGDSKEKKKRKRSHLEEEVINKELDEYYKLDYEDTIGDLKTRFKYRPVNAKRFGLNTSEVLMLDDKELNQHVPLKKIAPYREKEWNVPRNKIYTQKQRIKSLIQGEASSGEKSLKRKSRDDEKPQHEESKIDDINNQSKSSKRRQRQAPFKLSQSRLMAYGKIASKSTKSKKKQ